MRAILDTHTLLWFANGADEISNSALDVIRDSDNYLHVSVATLWEITIKQSLGKLPIPGSISDFVRREVEGNLFEIIPITTSHLEVLRHLPHHHRDPFDRMIIAQAIAEDMAIIGTDGAFKAYDIEMIW